MSTRSMRHENQASGWKTQVTMPKAGSGEAYKNTKTQAREHLNTQNKDFAKNSIWGSKSTVTSRKTIYGIE